MHTLLLVVIGLPIALAAPSNSPKIVGGSIATIDNYPYAAVMLFLRSGFFSQACAGSVINNRSILSAAHCFVGMPTVRWRTRVGSTYRHSGGTVFTIQRFIIHPDFDLDTTDNDIGLVVVDGDLLSNNVVAPARIAGVNYHLADNQEVWAIGWGTTSYQGLGSAELRHVQIWTINQAVCSQRYAELGEVITDNMLCSGWLDVGGRDQCEGDSGGPLLHNNVVVGVCSWGHQCAHPRYPGINARVSRFTEWIVSNA